MKRILGLLVAAAIAPVCGAADIEAGKAKVAQVCAACHGANGVSVSDTIPNLAAQRAGYIEAQLQALPPARAKDREAMRQSLQQSPFPRVRPHFGGFIVARDGALWVREFEGYDTGRPARYAVFDRDGRWLGLASFPHGFTVYQAGSDFALGTVKDADDVEHVRLYRLRASRK